MIHVIHPTEDAQASPEQTAEKTAQTAGEKLFNNLDYYGLGWIANAAIGVASTEIAFNNPNIGRIGFLDGILNDKNALYFAREKAVDGAVHFASNLIQNPEFDKLAKKIGTQLAQVDGHGLSEQTLKALQGVDVDVSKVKEAFFELHSKLGGYQGIADTLGSNNFTADTLKEAADYLIKKQTIQEVANKAAVLATLCIGGFAVMIPMKMMEDNKRWLVENLDKNVIDPVNHLLGKAPKTEEERAALEEARQERYREIEEEPKQTWGTMLGSRLLSLVPIYTLHMAWWNQNNVLKYGGGVLAGDPITNPDPNVGFGGAGHYAAKIGEVIEEYGIRKIVSEDAYKALGDNLQKDAKPFVKELEKKLLRTNLSPIEIGQKWLSEKAEWVVSDFGYSFIAATGTFKLTRFFGNHEEQEKKAASNIVPFNRLDSEKKEHKGAVSTPTTELALV